MTKSLFDLLEEEKWAVRALDSELSRLRRIKEELANIDADKLIKPDAPEGYWEWKAEHLEASIPDCERKVEDARKPVEDVRKELKKYISMIMSL